MISKKFNKKAEEESEAFSFLIKILLAIAVATVLYFLIRRIGYEFLPK